MVIIVLVTLVTAIAVVAAVAALCLRVLPARIGAQAEAERAATLRATLDTVRRESEGTVQAAVSTVVEVAGDKLGAQVAAGSRELDLRDARIAEQVDGMNGELRRVRDLVTRLQQDKAEQHGQLVSRLDESIRANSELTSVTGQLREALASPKARGSWGERMAEDVLRMAGLVNGVNYVTQTGVTGGGVPDLTFLLPGDRVLHMDVKFPVDNYLRHLEAEIDSEREVAARAFVKDVKTQIKGLAGREYLDDEASVDYLVMFVPNEAVYTFLHEQEPGIIDHALGQRIVLCSPLTLFPLLSVIRQATETLAVERTSGEILDRLAGFTAQWDKFTAQLDKLERSLSTTNRAFEELTGTRRRALERTMAEIDDLRTRRGLTEGDGGDPADPEGVTRLPDRRAG
jgi:DNA recombination protein RmuC